MSAASVWARQREAVVRAVVGWYIPGLLLFALMATVAAWRGIPLGNIVRDPASVTHAPFYTGAITLVEGLLWSAAAAICFFTYSLLKDRPDREMRLLLLFSGLGTVALVLDDLFQFHEIVYPWIFHLTEGGTHALYAAAALIYLVRFRAAILRTPYLIMVFSAVLLATKVVLDHTPMDPTWRIFEHSAKFAGITGWLAYITTSSLEQERETGAACGRRAPAGPT